MGFSEFGFKWSVHIIDTYTYIESSTCNPHFNFLIISNLKLVIYASALNHLTGFSEDIAFSCHFVASLLPPTLPSCRSASSIGYTSKKYQKWREIHLATAVITQ